MSDIVDANLQPASIARLRQGFYESVGRRAHKYISESLRQEGAASRLRTPTEQVRAWSPAVVAIALNGDAISPDRKLVRFEEAVEEQDSVAQPDQGPKVVGQYGSPQWAIDELADPTWAAARASRDLRLAAASTHDTGLARQRIYAALGWLSDAWPEAAEEVLRLVSMVVIVDVPATTSAFSASRISTFGAIYSSLPPTTLAAYETLVHETAHHDLYLRQFYCRMLKNPNQETYNPIRRERRPLSGVLHAAHVLTRMTEALSRLEISGAIDQCDDSTEAVGDRLDSLRALRDATLDLLKDNAAWTEGGGSYFQRLVGSAYL